MNPLVDEPCATPLAYHDESDQAIVRPILDRQLSADVVVVGGGITGSSLALHLAKAGKSVVQLETKQPGWGGSGRAYGLAVPYCKHSESRIISHFGAEQGDYLISTLAQGPELMHSLLQEFDIDAAYDSSGWILGAYSKQAGAGLRTRADYWQARGADVELLSSDEITRYTGSQYYNIALLDRRALSINPLAYTSGLFRAAEKLGVEQFTNSAVIAITREQSGEQEVRTEQGSVRCKSVFLCTNAYSDKLWPGLDRCFVPVRGFQATTEPFDPDLLRDILPENHILTDTRHLWSGIRKLPNGSMHLSVGGPSIGSAGSAFLDQAAKRLQAVYPQLSSSIKWQNEWSGWVAVTPDQYPKIVQLDDNVWTGFGYSGRGLALATLMGRELSKCVSGTPDSRLMLPIEQLKKIPFHRLAPFGAALMMKWYSFSDYLAERSR